MFVYIFIYYIYMPPEEAAKCLIIGDYYVISSPLRITKYPSIMSFQCQIAVISHGCHFQSSPMSNRSGIGTNQCKWTGHRLSSIP